MNKKTEKKPTKKEVELDFSLFDEHLDPSEITHEIGLEPTEAVMKGETFLLGGKVPRISKYGRWRLSSGCSFTASVEEHTQRLVDILYPRRKTVEALSKKYKGRFFYGLYLHREITFEFDSILLYKISELGVNLDFDTYFFEQKENDG